jgi:hypothetical protein
MQFLSRGILKKKPFPEGQESQSQQKIPALQE